MPTTTTTSATLSSSAPAITATDNNIINDTRVIPTTQRTTAITIIPESPLKSQSTKISKPSSEHASQTQLTSRNFQPPTENKSNHHHHPQQQQREQQQQQQQHEDSLIQQLNQYDQHMSRLTDYIQKHRHLEKLYTYDIAFRLALYNNQGGIKEKRKIDTLRHKILHNLKYDSDDDDEEKKHDDDNTKVQHNGQSLSTSSSAAAATAPITTIPTCTPQVQRKLVDEFTTTSNNNIDTTAPDQFVVTLRLCDGVSFNKNNTLTSPTTSLSFQNNQFDIQMTVNTSISLSRNIQAALQNMVQKERLLICPLPARDTTEMSFHLLINTDDKSNNQNGIIPIKESHDLKAGKIYLLSHDMTKDKDQYTTLFIYRDTKKQNNNDDDDNEEKNTGATSDDFQFCYLDLPPVVPSIRTIHNIVQSVFGLENITYHKFDGSITSTATPKSYARIVTHQLKRGKQSVPTTRYPNKSHDDDDDDNEIKNQEIPRETVISNAPISTTASSPTITTLESSNPTTRVDIPSVQNRRRRGRPSRSSNDQKAEKRNETSNKNETIENKDQQQVGKQQNIASDDENDDKDQPPLKKPRGRPSKNKNIGKRKQNPIHMHNNDDQHQSLKKPRGRPRKNNNNEKCDKVNHDDEDDDDDEDDQNQEPPPLKKPRGRPSKNISGKENKEQHDSHVFVLVDDDYDQDQDEPPLLKKPRGRPPKIKQQAQQQQQPIPTSSPSSEPTLRKKPRGRPPKQTTTFDTEMKKSRGRPRKDESETRSTKLAKLSLKPIHRDSMHNSDDDNEKSEVSLKYSDDDDDSEDEIKTSKIKSNIGKLTSFLKPKYPRLLSAQKKKKK